MSRLLFVFVSEFTSPSLLSLSYLSDSSGGTLPLWTSREVPAPPQPGPPPRRPRGGGQRAALPRAVRPAGPLAPGLAGPAPAAPAAGRCARGRRPEDPVTRWPSAAPTPVRGGGTSHRHARAEVVPVRPGPEILPSSSLCRRSFTRSPTAHAICRAYCPLRRPRAVWVPHALPGWFPVVNPSRKRGFSGLLGDVPQFQSS